MGDENARPDIEALREMLRRIEQRSSDGLQEPRPPVVLEEAVAGSVVETPRGALYLVDEPAEAFLEETDEFSSVTSLFFDRRQSNRGFLEKKAPALTCLCDLEPERLLFLDIETAGFHGMGLFLVGLLLYREGSFRIRQLFARNYAEEAAVLEHLRAYYDSSDVIVTFNGRAFDLPFINDRSVIHRVELRAPRLDIDLLHVARRLWKDYLPNCRLVTLEEMVCNRRRTGDLPSHLIPKAYHDYVETGDARLMADVIRHNAYDLVTMAHLLAKIANG